MKRKLMLQSRWPGTARRTKRTGASYMGAIILCVLFLTPCSLLADTYYVSAQSGDDDLGDGSMGNPWLTISHAADVVVAGDTVVVREGTYFEQVEPQNSGSPLSPIVFEAFAGEQVVLDGGSVRAHGFLISDRAWVSIRGMEIRNYLGTSVGRQAGGVMVQPSSLGSDGVVVENCVFVNCTFGAVHVAASFGSSEDIRISGNQIIDCGSETTLDRAIFVQDGIDIEISGNYIDHRGPGVSQVGDEGIYVIGGAFNRILDNLVQGADHAIFLDAASGLQQDATVSGNTVTFGNDDGIFINRVTDSLVSNNVCHGRGDDGIDISVNASNVDILDNFVVWSHGSADSNSVGIIVFGTDVRVEGNISMINEHAEFASTQLAVMNGLISDFNVFFHAEGEILRLNGNPNDLSGWQTLTGLDLNSRSTFPLLRFEKPILPESTLHYE